MRYNCMYRMTSVPIRWHAHEHEHVERGRDWFAALGIAAACFALISIILGNFLFGLLILVAAGTLAILAKSPPPLMEFEISDRGIRTGETMHRYEEILAFWVEDHDADPPILLVDTTKWMSPNLVIPLGGADAKQVRAFLAERTKETPMKEPVSHKILEFFGL